MAENLREAYKTKVAVESSNLPSKIKAFQKYFQVHKCYLLNIQLKSYTYTVICFMINSI